MTEKPKVTYHVRIRGSDGSNYLADWNWLGNELVVRSECLKDLSQMVSSLRLALQAPIINALKTQIVRTLKDGKAYRRDSLRTAVDHHGVLYGEFFDALTALLRAGVLTEQRGWIRLAKAEAKG